MARRQTNAGSGLAVPGRSRWPCTRYEKRPGRSAFMQASPATGMRPDPRPETLPTECARGAPDAGHWRLQCLPGLVPEADPRPVAALAWCLFPRLAAPGRDRVFVPLRGPVRRHLGVNPIRCSRYDTPRGVYDLPDRRVISAAAGPVSSAGPGPSHRRRAGVQRRAEPGELVFVQLAGVPARSFRCQVLLAVGPSGALPLVHRLHAHPQRPGDLPGVRVLHEHIRGLEPYLLPLGPFPHGQPAAIRISHDTGLNPPTPPVTQARRP